MFRLAATVIAIQLLVIGPLGNPASAEDEEDGPIEPDSAATTTIQPQGILSLPNAPSSTVNIAFDGMKSDGPLRPPDTHGAVGPGGIIAVVNRRIDYYSKNGFEKWGSPVSLISFFSSVGALSGLFDPMALYDPSTSRFYVTVIENPGSVNDCSSSSRARSYIYLAASKTSDPSTTTSSDWWFYRVEATYCENGLPYLGDFPKIGFDSQAIYLTVNLYPFPLVEPFKRCEILVIPKSQIGAATLSPTIRYTPPSVSGGYTLQPSVILNGNPSVEYFAEVLWTASDKVRIWALSDPLGTATLTSATLTVPNNGGGDVSQAGWVPQCTVGDGRLRPVYIRAQNQALWYNGALWFCHTAGASSGRSIVFYYKVNTNGFPTGTPTLAESGGFDGGSGVFSHLPAIGGNSEGTIGITFTQSSTSMCPRIVFAARDATAPSFGPLAVLKQSETAADFSPHWGDYAVVSADPTDNSFWVAHLYARTDIINRNWGTWWANVTVSACATCGDPKTSFANCGKWEAVPTSNWPNGITAVHMVLTNAGKVLLWGRTNGVARAYHWDPVTQVGVPVSSTPIDSTLMNSGHVTLSDGRILIIGGEFSPFSPPPNSPVGTARSTIFDPQAPCGTECGWVAAPLGPQARWHPAATTLADGRVLVTSGWQHASLLANLPVVYSGQWSSVSSAQKTDLSLAPFMVLDPSPNGSRVVYLGPGSGANAVEPPFGVLQTAQRLGDLAASNPTWNASVGTYAVRGGAMAIFDKGRVLKSGGTPTGGGNSSKKAETTTIDLTTGSLSVAAEADMCVRRAEHQLVVLPDGSVVAVGGSAVEERANDQYFRGVYDTELWRASTGWTKLGPMSHRAPPTPRMYHSSAVLVPDGRVLVAGGQSLDDFSRCPGFPDQFCANGDFFSPPYLFRADNSSIADADRPAITGNVPLSAAYGEGLSFGRSVGSGAVSITKVALVRPGSTTRSTDMEQRYIPLTFVDGSPLTVASSQMPISNQAPPGFYMLFVINNLGRPSKAPFVAVWELKSSSLSHSLSYGVGTFTVTVTWKTTAKAVDGDVLVLTPPGGSPISVSGTPSDPSGVTHSLSYTGQCAPNQTWTYYVRSKRPRYSPGDALSISTSYTKTFKVQFCVD